MSETARILTMEPPRPAMGWQIEYEIYPEKTPEAHPEIELSISMQDSIHWFCRTKKFRVVSVHPDPESRNAPEPLFYRPFSEDNIDEFTYHVNSGPGRSKVGVGFRYKPVFEFEDKTKLDPHIRTT
jgi:hypothetical protein